MSKVRSEKHRALLHGVLQVSASRASDSVWQTFSTLSVSLLSRITVTPSAIEEEAHALAHFVVRFSDSYLSQWHSGEGLVLCLLDPRGHDSVSIYCIAFRGIFVIFMSLGDMYHEVREFELLSICTVIIIRTDRCAWSHAKPNASANIEGLDITTPLLRIFLCRCQGPLIFPSSLTLNTLASWQRIDSLCSAPSCRICIALGSWPCCCGVPAGRRGQVAST